MACSGLASRELFRGAAAGAPTPRAGAWPGFTTEAREDKVTLDSRYGTGVVRFYSNGDAVEAEPLPTTFSEEAVFVVTFGFEGASARIVGFS